ncbi:biopolymer transporter ExbD [Parasedimentitalea maritima]|uniref:Biopolymer transporter ExbD n=1 Tax=Parasedimentitalea maritima TaxID=2578117 RepID=A0ABY2UPR6_9RHOB|nr:biopolymer transporter ExbD [Zongyanglinia marina]TLP56465.1 biopolymer transporter ExbD [Zongyanglinia marina]
MRIKQPIASQKEPTIALINIVFLMLVFFMIAGTLAVPLDKELRLIETTGLEGREPPDTLVVHADGRLSLQGKPLADTADFLATLSADELKVVRIVPDRALPAKRLVALGNLLRQGGADRLMLVSEKGLK